MVLDNLSQLLSCLSEILFFYGLLGFCYWLFKEYRQHNFRNCCFVVAILLFMLGWRFQMHLNSSRYLSALLIPAMIFAVCLFYDSGLKCFWGRILLAAFVLYGILKVCPDKSKYYELDALTKIIAAQKSDCRVVYDLTKENSRLRYLFGKAGLDPNMLIDCSMTPKAQLLFSLERETYFNKHFCVIIKDSENKAPLLRKKEIDAFVRSCETIAEIPSRHSASYRVFSITSPDSKVLPYQDVITFAETHPQYQLPNGNFQQCQSPAESYKLSRKFADAGFSFFANNSYVWPVGWEVVIYLPSPGKDSFKACRNKQGELVLGSFYNIQLLCKSGFSLNENQIVAIQLRPLSDCKIRYSLQILPPLSEKERAQIPGGKITPYSKGSGISWYVDYLKSPPVLSLDKRTYLVIQVHEGEAALLQVCMFPVSVFGTWQREEILRNSKSNTKTEHFQ